MHGIDFKQLNSKRFCFLRRSEELAARNQLVYYKVKIEIVWPSPRYGIRGEAIREREAVAANLATHNPAASPTNQNEGGRIGVGG